LRFFFLLIASLLCASPAFAKSANCPLSQVSRQLILDEIAHLPAVDYSNTQVLRPGFTETNEADSRFPLDLRITALADKEQNLVLFRGIQTEYRKDFNAVKGKNFVTAEGKAYSYSLSPEMVAHWNWGQVVLISIQNVHGDKLLFPKPDENASTLRNWVAVGPESKMGEIAHYDEIKVPVQNERVVAVMDQKEFAQLVDSYGSKPFRLGDLLKRILDAKTVHAPDCTSMPPAPNAAKPDKGVFGSERKPKRALTTEKPAETPTEKAGTENTEAR
jgi:hypothetical protein